MLRSLSLTALTGIISILSVVPVMASDSTRDGQWYLGALNVRDAHRLAKGDGVTVGLIDTGVQASHPDLVGNILSGVDLTGRDSKGLIDTDGHGTAMAGIIVAHGHGEDSSEGALGVAPHAKIFPIRDGESRVDSSRNLAAAVDEAVKRRVGVLSMSLGTGGNPALGDAIRRALAANVVVVASTGNRPDDVFIGYPAKYPGVLAVGATERDGRLAPVTVTGKEMMLVAPGVGIISTDSIGGYRRGSGTSDSTAIVAGAAALVRSRFPKLSAAEVVHRLTATATDMGPPGRDSTYGFGALNLVAALTANVPPLDSATSPPPATASPTVLQSATPAPNAGANVQLRLGSTIFLVGTIFGITLLAGIALVVWLLVRRNAQNMTR